MRSPMNTEWVIALTPLMKAGRAHFRLATSRLLSTTAAAPDERGQMSNRL